MFEDRKEAGQKLAKALEKYKNQEILVLAIPKGGVEVGFEVAVHLRARFSLVIVRKLPFPDNPEAGFGAVAEDGSSFLLQPMSSGISPQQIKRVKKTQIEEIQRRIQSLRQGKPLPQITGRKVILTDDGLAMGSTMRAAIKLCQKKNPQKLIVAVPVAGKKVAREMESLVNETIILETPSFFQAVAQVYKNWYDVPDSEVLNIMNKWEKRESH
ncbi:phosphoribosyltransferase [bacterium]|nr:phosphoribosyltransferase [bacterium]